MMRVLGINCGPKIAHLAVLEDGVIDSDAPQRLEAPTGMETGEGLLECIAEARRMIATARTGQIVLLAPESSAAPSAERVEFETLIRVAAAEEKIPVSRISRQAVRSKLGLPRKGPLKDHIATGAGPASGKYWLAGRALAAMAARVVP